MTTPSPDPRRWWALGAIVACMLTLGFDGTILNVALPTMAGELHADSSTLQLIGDSYLVVLAALMLPAGFLGDRFGRRRMLVTGLAVFLAGSLLGTLADDSATVIAARSVMGVGAGLIFPLTMSVVPTLFAPGERAKAMGLVSAASALGLPLGPILGGLLLNHYWWGSIFLINVPLIAIAMVACLTLLPETSDPSAPRVDALTTVLTVTGLGSLVYGVNEGPARGWSSPVVLGMLAASVVLITALVLWESRQARPMLDLSLLRHRGFLWNTVAASLVMFTLTGLMFVLPAYLQTVLGNDALGTGVRMMPMPLGMLVASRAIGPLLTRWGPRPVICAGLGIMAAAAFTGGTTSVHDGYGFTAVWLALVGLGFGMAVVPAMTGGLSALPRDRAGSGSGLLMTLRQVAGAIGLAILGSVIAGSYTAHLDTGRLPHPAASAAQDSVIGAHAVAAKLGDRALAHSADLAYLHGMDLALVICGITALAALALVAAFLPNPRPEGGTDDREVVTESAHA
ncbi:DHA2 family efflux MFS transporter permease subunit [Streptomyces orinoci]|uniref:DHA2 family efflux MFS transporter permease subunit n=1 Tax=Streptomyces orinoci TaxID=67339 RepID=A0ABV3JVY1_STRON|nr:DHA2 family efflux MFS transporter permease subunit [Streptomyces orinoci]